MVAKQSRALIVAVGAVVVTATIVLGAAIVLQGKPLASVAARTPGVIAADTRSFGLPFRPGTTVSIGVNGLHDDNFGPMAGYTLIGAGSVTDASLDVLAPAIGTPVVALAAGRVLASVPGCGFLLIDHGNGTWVEYLHLAPTIGPNDPSFAAGAVIGTTLPPVGAGWTPDPVSHCGTVISTAAHVHFAFLRSSGPTTATYVSMTKFSLCGHQVTAAGDIVGLGIANGPAFVVPATCGASSPPAQTPGVSPSPNVTLSPSPPPPVLDGTWVAPKANATIKTAKLTLVSRPTASLTDVNLTKVVYSIAWGSKPPVAACTATKPAADGSWACSVDVWKLGGALGKLTLSFDVFDDTGDVAHSPDGLRIVTYAAPPPGPVVTEAESSKRVPCTWDTTFVVCWWDTFSWRVLPDRTARVQVFEVWTGEGGGTCAKSLSQLQADLRPGSGVPLNGILFGQSLASVTGFRVQGQPTVGGGSRCGVYVRAVNAFGASSLAPAKVVEVP